MEQFSSKMAWIPGLAFKYAWNANDKVSGSRDKKGLILLTDVSNFRNTVTSAKVVEM